MEYVCTRTNNLLRILDPKFKDIDEKYKNTFEEAEKLNQLELQNKADKKANKNHSLEISDKYCETKEYIKQERKRIHYIRIVRNRARRINYVKILQTWRHNRMMNLDYDIRVLCHNEIHLQYLPKQLQNKGFIKLFDSKLGELVRRNSQI